MSNSIGRYEALVTAYEVPSKKVAEHVHDGAAITDAETFEAERLQRELAAARKGGNGSKRTRPAGRSCAPQNGPIRGRRWPKSNISTGRVHMCERTKDPVKSWQRRATPGRSSIEIFGYLIAVPSSCGSGDICRDPER